MTTAGLARASRLGWRALMGWLSMGWQSMGWQRVAGSALVLAAIMAGGAAPPAGARATPAGARTTPAGPSCLKAAGPFSVHGTQVLGQGGQPFVSDGLTVPGLQVLDWRNFTGLDRQKIVADAVTGAPTRSGCS